MSNANEKEDPNWRKTEGKGFYKEKYWRQKVAEQRNSELSQNEFCRVSGLNANQFSWWLRQIAKRDQENLQLTKGPFVQLTQATKRARHGSQLQEELEIVLPSGASIKVTAGTPLPLLSKVLKMLEG